MAKQHLPTLHPSPTKTRKIAVISHTHWDREWYLPFQQFRWKLVTLMDEMLRVLKSEFCCFMLDGQTILLEDYLELRPHRAQELRKHISSGRVLVGPWYVLPDEFLVSGEALIRNLAMGDEVARQFGKSMRVGYLPDQFGHIAQMPQILRGFGLDSAVIWRGVGDELTKSEFIWQAPDGSQVLTLHLPTGYFNGQQLPADTAQFLERVAKIRDGLESRANTEYIVIMNGGDHQFVQGDLPMILDAASKNLDDVEISHTCLPELMEHLRGSIQAKGIDLQIIEGELRNCKRAHLLPGVFSSRMWIKQQNTACENLLEKWAEPFSAWATLEGPSTMDRPMREYGDLDATGSKAALKLAWKHLLQNHPHDSICGCSVDQVHEEMRTRFNWSKGIAEGLAHQAIEQIAGHVDTMSVIQKAHAGVDNEQICVVVFNPAEGPRTDYVTFTAKNIDGERFAIRDDQAHIYPCQILQKRINPVNFLPEIDFGFVATQVPGYGYKTFHLIRDAEPRAHERASIQGNTIENEYFLVQADPKIGTLTITDKTTGRRYEGLNLFMDGGDAGDEYNYDQPANDAVIVGPSQEPRIQIVDHGPSLFALRIAMDLSVPIELAKDRQSRAKKKADLPVVTDITLYPGVRRIDIHTEVDNVAKDHRLRVHFPTGVHSDYSFADSHFAIERRPVDLPRSAEDWIESPVGTFPQKGFVYVKDNDGGLTVANRGLAEYEVLRAPSGLTIALTLLRCAGWLSRDDLRSRKGPAGPIVPAPGGQCPGKHTFDYSLIPHFSEDQDLSADAHSFNHPLRAQPTFAHEGRLPHQASFVTVKPSGLVISALKQAEQGEGVVLRLYNPLPHPVAGELSIYRPFAKAYLANLREEGLKLLATDASSVSLDVNPSQIVTLRFFFY